MIILITQKQEKNEHDERIDILESTYTKYFADKGFVAIPLPNNSENLNLLKYADCVVLSGGGDIEDQPQRNEIEKKVIDYCIKEKVPLLGICRGMQQINSYFGGSLTEVFGHAKNHKIKITDLFKKKKGYVNSYHNFGIVDEFLSSRLKSFAVSQDDIIEGLYHPEHTVIGVQWHPERDSDYSWWIDKHVLDWLNVVIR